MSELTEWIEQMGMLGGKALRWCLPDRGTQPDRAAMVEAMSTLVRQRGEYFSRLGVVQRPSGGWCVAVLIDEGYARRVDAEDVLLMFIERMDREASSPVQSSALAHIRPQSQGA